jgi:outer membrane protein assembly factor BamB
MRIATLVILGCLVVPASAANWPRFRGPNGTGISDDKDVPVEWSDANRLWKTALPGVGHSSPVVWGDRVFLESASNQGRERQLVCVSATTGKVLWTKHFLAVPAHTHPLNTLASSTPAVDGERVYALVWDGKGMTLMAHDLDGKLDWKRDLGGFTSQHGVGASPVVYDGRVYLANDQDGQSTLLAFDAKTGRSLWQAERRAYRACYSTPFLMQRPGGRSELVVASTTAITGYNPETGAQEWNWNWTFTARMPLRTTASPVFGPEMIFASSGDGGGDRHMVAIKLTRTADGTEPERLWENKKDFPYVPTMLYWKGHLYSVNDVGIASCHVAATGKSVWSERLNGSFSASPILVDGKFYAINGNGEVYVLEASPSYRLLARNSVGEPVSATPAVADGRLFVRGRNHLFCFGKAAAAGHSSSQR